MKLSFFGADITIPGAGMGVPGAALGTLLAYSAGGVWMMSYIFNRSTHLSHRRGRGRAVHSV